MPVQPSPAHRLRRLTGGAGLILFPALLLAGTLVNAPDNGTSAGVWLGATRHPGAVAAAAVTLLFSGVFMVPAALAILHQARDRGAGLANVAAVVAVLGGFGNCFIATFSLVSLSVAGGDHTQMTAYLDRVNGSAIVGAVGTPLVLCFGLGAALLVWAAWRTGLVGWWAPAIVTAIAVVYDFVLDHPPYPVAVVLQAIPALVFGYLGARVLRLRDSEWNAVSAHRPQAAATAI
jgi:hypothetical protein